MDDDEEYQGYRRDKITSFDGHSLSYTLWLSSKNHVFGVNTLTYNKTRSVLVSGGRDAAIRIWSIGENISDTKCTDTLSFHQDWVTGVLILENRYPGQDGAVVFFDMDQHSRQDNIKQHTDYVTCLALHPNGTSFMTSSLDGRAYRFDSGGFRNTYRLANVLPPLDANPDNHGIYCVACSKDSAYLAFAYADFRVVTSTGTAATEFNTLRHPAVVKTMMFVGSEQYLLTGCSDGTLRLWELSLSVCRVEVPFEDPIWCIFQDSDTDFIYIGFRSGAIFTICPPTEDEIVKDLIEQEIIKTDEDRAKLNPSTLYLARFTNARIRVHSFFPTVHGYDDEEVDDSILAMTMIDRDPDNPDDKKSKLLCVSTTMTGIHFLEPFSTHEEPERPRLFHTIAPDPAIVECASLPDQMHIMARLSNNKVLMWNVMNGKLEKELGIGSIKDFLAQASQPEEYRHPWFKTSTSLGSISVKLTVPECFRCYIPRIRWRRRKIIRVRQKKKYAVRIRQWEGILREDAILKKQAKLREMNKKRDEEERERKKKEQAKRREDYERKKMMEEECQIRKLMRDERIEAGEDPQTIPEFEFPPEEVKEEEPQPEQPTPAEKKEEDDDYIEFDDSTEESFSEEVEGAEKWEEIGNLGQDCLFNIFNSWNGWDSFHRSAMNDQPGTPIPQIFPDETPIICQNHKHDVILRAQVRNLTRATNDVQDDASQGWRMYGEDNGKYLIPRWITESLMDGQLPIKIPELKVMLMYSGKVKGLGQYFQPPISDTTRVFPVETQPLTNIGSFTFKIPETMLVSTLYSYIQTSFESLLQPLPFRAPANATEKKKHKISVVLSCRGMSLDELPLPILGKILSRCGLQSRLSLMLVCKSFYSALKLHTDSLDFSGTRLTPEKTAYLILASPNLTRLDLSHNIQLSQQDLSNISGRHANLRELSLVGLSEVNDGIVAEFALKSKLLEKLDLTLTSITEGLTIFLGRLQYLNHLSLRQTSTSSLSFAQFGKSYFTNLTTLDLGLVNGDLDDEGIIALSASCHKLENLSLYGASNITDDSFIKLARVNPFLSVLSLRGCTGIRDLTILSITMHCQNMTKLNIIGCSSLTDQALYLIGGAKELLSEDIHYAFLSECALKESARFTRTHSVQSPDSISSDFIPTGLSGIIPTTITTRNNLENPVPPPSQSTTVRSPSSSSAMEKSFGLVRLTQLKLGWCTQFTSNAIASVSRGCPSLNKLDLRCLNVDSDMPWALVGINKSRKEKVSLEPSPLQPSALSPSSTFTSSTPLSASATFTSPAPLSTSPNQIQNSSPITTFTPYASGLNPTANYSMVGLMQSLSFAAQNTILVSLNLSYCTDSVNDTILTSLAKCLPSLQVLSLKGCQQITDKGVTLLSAHCHMLTSLSLEDCIEVGDDSLVALSRNCFSLRELGMFGCDKRNKSRTLHITAGEGNVSLTRFFLKSHFAVDSFSTDQDELTPLMTTCSSGFSNVVSLLIEEGHADVNCICPTGWTPLKIACISGHVQIIHSLLFRYGAHPDLSGRIGRMTPLHCAAIAGCAEGVKLLIDAGADINAFTTKLIKATLPLHIQLTAPTPINTDPNGASLPTSRSYSTSILRLPPYSTPVHCALQSMSSPSVIILLKAGARLFPPHLPVPLNPSPSPRLDQSTQLTRQTLVPLNRMSVQFTSSSNLRPPNMATGAMATTLHHLSVITFHAAVTSSSTTNLLLLIALGFDLNDQLLESARFSLVSPQLDEKAKVGLAPHSLTQPDVMKPSIFRKISRSSSAKQSNEQDFVDVTAPKRESPSPQIVDVETLDHSLIIQNYQNIKLANHSELQQSLFLMFSPVTTPTTFLTDSTEVTPPTSFTEMSVEPDIQSFIRAVIHLINETTSVLHTQQIAGASSLMHRLINGADHSSSLILPFIALRTPSIQRQIGASTSLLFSFLRLPPESEATEFGQCNAEDEKEKQFEEEHGWRMSSNDFPLSDNIPLPSPPPVQSNHLRKSSSFQLKRWGSAQLSQGSPQASDTTEFVGSVSSHSSQMSRKSDPNSVPNSHDYLPLAFHLFSSFFALRLLTSNGDPHDVSASVFCSSLIEDSLSVIERWTQRLMMETERVEKLRQSNRSEDGSTVLVPRQLSQLHIAAIAEAALFFLSVFQNGKSFETTFKCSDCADDTPFGNRPQPKRVQFDDSALPQQLPTGVPTTVSGLIIRFVICLLNIAVADYTRAEILASSTATETTPIGLFPSYPLPKFNCENVFTCFSFASGLEVARDPKPYRMLLSLCLPLIFHTLVLFQSHPAATKVGHPLCFPCSIVSCIRHQSFSRTAATHPHSHFQRLIKILSTFTDGVNQLNLTNAFIPPSKRANLSSSALSQFASQPTSQLSHPPSLSISTLDSLVSPESIPRPAFISSFDLLCPHLTSISLNNCHLTSIPSALFAPLTPSSLYFSNIINPVDDDERVTPVLAPTLTYLDLSCNELEFLPHALVLLSNLSVLNFLGNARLNTPTASSLPLVLSSQLPHLSLLLLPNTNSESFRPILKNTPVPPLTQADPISLIHPLSTHQRITMKSIIREEEERLTVLHPQEDNRVEHFINTHPLPNTTSATLLPSTASLHSLPFSDPDTPPRKASLVLQSRPPLLSSPLSSQFNTSTSDRNSVSLQSRAMIIGINSIPSLSLPSQQSSSIVVVRPSHPSSIRQLTPFINQRWRGTNYVNLSFLSSSFSPPPQHINSRQYPSLSIQPRQLVPFFATSSSNTPFCKRLPPNYLPMDTDFQPIPFAHGGSSEIASLVSITKPDAIINPLTNEGEWKSKSLFTPLPTFSDSPINGNALADGRSLSAPDDFYPFPTPSPGLSVEHAPHDDDQHATNVDNLLAVPSAHAFSCVYVLSCECENDLNYQITEELLHSLSLITFNQSFHINNLQEQDSQEPFGSSRPASFKLSSSQSPFQSQSIQPFGRSHPFQRTVHTLFNFPSKGMYTSLVHLSSTSMITHNKPFAVTASSLRFFFISQQFAAFRKANEISNRSDPNDLITYPYPFLITFQIPLIENTSVMDNFTATRESVINLLDTLHTLATQYRLRIVVKLVCAATISQNTSGFNLSPIQQPFLPSPSKTPPRSMTARENVLTSLVQMPNGEIPSVIFDDFKRNAQLYPSFSFVWEPTAPLPQITRPYVSPPSPVNSGNGLDLIPQASTTLDEFTRLLTTDLSSLYHNTWQEGVLSLFHPESQSIIIPTASTSLNSSTAKLSHQNRSSPSPEPNRDNSDTNGTTFVLDEDDETDAEVDSLFNIYRQSHLSIDSAATSFIDAQNANQHVVALLSLETGRQERKQHRVLSKRSTLNDILSITMSSKLSDLEEDSNPEISEIDIRHPFVIANTIQSTCPIITPKQQKKRKRMLTQLWIDLLLVFPQQNAPALHRFQWIDGLCDDPELFTNDIVSDKPLSHRLFLMKHLPIEFIPQGILTSERLDKIVSLSTKIQGTTTDLTESAEATSPLSKLISNYSYLLGLSYTTLRTLLLTGSFPNSDPFIACQPPKISNSIPTPSALPFFQGVFSGITNPVHNSQGLVQILAGPPPASIANIALPEAKLMKERAINAAMNLQAAAPKGLHQQNDDEFDSDDTDDSDAPNNLKRRPAVSLYSSLASIPNLDNSVRVNKRRQPPTDVNTEIDNLNPQTVSLSSPRQDDSFFEKTLDFDQHDFHHLIWTVISQVDDQLTPHFQPFTSSIFAAAEQQSPSYGLDILLSSLRSLTKDFVIPLSSNYVAPETIPAWMRIWEDSQFNNVAEHEAWMDFESNWVMNALAEQEGLFKDDPAERNRTVVSSLSLSSSLTFKQSPSLSFLLLRTPNTFYSRSRLFSLMERFSHDATTSRLFSAVLMHWGMWHHLQGTDQDAFIVNTQWTVHLLAELGVNVNKLFFQQEDLGSVASEAYQARKNGLVSPHLQHNSPYIHPIMELLHHFFNLFAKSYSGTLPMFNRNICGPQKKKHLPPLSDNNSPSLWVTSLFQLRPISHSFNSLWPRQKSSFVHKFSRLFSFSVDNATTTQFMALHALLSFQLHALFPILKKLIQTLAKNRSECLHDLEENRLFESLMGSFSHSSENSKSPPINGHTVTPTEEKNKVDWSFIPWDHMTSTIHSYDSLSNTTIHWNSRGCIGSIKADIDPAFHTPVPLDSASDMILSSIAEYIEQEEQRLTSTVQARHFVFEKSQPSERVRSQTLIDSAFINIDNLPSYSSILSSLHLPGHDPLIESVQSPISVPIPPPPINPDVSTSEEIVTESESDDGIDALLVGLRHISKSNQSRRRGHKAMESPVVAPAPTQQIKTLSARQYSPQLNSPVTMVRQLSSVPSQELKQSYSKPNPQAVVSHSLQSIRSFSSITQEPKQEETEEESNMSIDDISFSIDLLTPTSLKQHTNATDYIRISVAGHDQNLTRMIFTLLNNSISRLLNQKELTSVGNVTQKVYVVSEPLTPITNWDEHFSVLTLPNTTQSTVPQQTDDQFSPSCLIRDYIDLVQRTILEICQKLTEHNLQSIVHPLGHSPFAKEIIPLIFSMSLLVPEIFYSSHIARNNPRSLSLFAPFSIDVLLTATELMSSWDLISPIISAPMLYRLQTPSLLYGVPPSIVLLQSFTNLFSPQLFACVPSSTFSARVAIEPSSEHTQKAHIDTKVPHALPSEFDHPLAQSGAIHPSQKPPPSFFRTALEELSSQPKTYLQEFSSAFMFLLLFTHQSSPSSSLMNTKRTILVPWSSVTYSNPTSIINLLQHIPSNPTVLSLAAEDRARPRFTLVPSISFVLSPTLCSLTEIILICHVYWIVKSKKIGEARRIDMKMFMGEVVNSSKSPPSQAPQSSNSVGQIKVSSPHVPGHSSNTPLPLFQSKTIAMSPSRSTMSSSFLYSPESNRPISPDSSLELTVFLPLKKFTILKIAHDIVSGLLHLKQYLPAVFAEESNSFTSFDWSELVSPSSIFFLSDPFDFTLDKNTLNQPLATICPFFLKSSPKTTHYSVPIRSHFYRTDSTTYSVRVTDHLVHLLLELFDLLIKLSATPVYETQVTSPSAASPFISLLPWQFLDPAPSETKIVFGEWKRDESKLVDPNPEFDSTNSTLPMSVSHSTFNARQFDQQRPTKQINLSLQLLRSLIFQKLSSILSN
ncbi:putative leucine Rich Repeat family protein [Blattamonas nauphoetae]|uniref:Leucine-rich repeat and WD repeat-containing protein 1 n=1 Tax=Blattamonas nauphoetae TaxID=2049346 RepID=A0ABQ9XXA6_9EUKA|nr:putative leucine Rich Repeat family protein [Blattamonas nauphoetae]